MMRLRLMILSIEVCLNFEGKSSSKKQDDQFNRKHLININMIYHQK